MFPHHLRWLMFAAFLAPTAVHAGSRAAKPPRVTPGAATHSNRAAVDFGPDAALLLRYHTTVRQGGHTEPQPFVITTGVGEELIELHEEHPGYGGVHPVLRIRDGNGVRVPTQRDLGRAGLGTPSKVKAALSGWILELTGTSGDVSSDATMKRARAALNERLLQVEPLLDAVVAPRKRGGALDDLVYRAFTQAIYDGRLDPRLPSLRRLGPIEIMRVSGKGALSLTHMHLPSTGEQELVVAFAPEGGAWRAATLSDLTSMGINDLSALEAAARIARDKI